jgi:hypothetical protein
LPIQQNCKSPLFYWLKVVRPGGFELPTSWFVAARSTLQNLARGVANRANSASWNKSPQTAFSFICRHLLHICRHFPQFALHFRDSSPRRAWHEQRTCSCINLTRPRIVSRVRRCCQIFLSLASQLGSNLSQCHTFRKQQPTSVLTSEDPVPSPKIFVPLQEFLIDRSRDVDYHPRPKHLGFPLDLPPIKSEIVAVFQPEKPIRGEPLQSCKLRYFNSFEFLSRGQDS